MGSERITKIADLYEFLDVDDVKRIMKCGREKAYQHMRAATGRAAGETGMLRVSVPAWVKYLERTCESTNARDRSPTKRSGTKTANAANDQRSVGTVLQLSKSRSDGSAKPLIPTVRERGTPR